MAINTLADWRANGAHARQSILGRPRRKDEGREPDGEDEDDVKRSPATEHHIQTFFDALQAGDTAEQSHALAKIVDTWRADNNAGGLPVYAHQPLPNAFAKSLGEVMRSAPNPEGKSMMASLATKLEPGARLSVSQQLAGQLAQGTQSPMPRQKPQRPIPYNDNDQVQPHAPTWSPEEHQRTWMEWLRSWTESPEPKLPVEVTPRSSVSWDEELRQRSAAGARNRQRQERFDDERAHAGIPLSPDEQLRRDVAGDLRRRGKEPLYLSPKAAHPDDPYKDRVAWPAQPQFQEGATDVTVVSPWGPRFNNTQFHPGVDFRNRRGRPAFSPKNGTILAVSQSPRGGNEVFVLLDDGSIVSYAHTSILDDGQGRKLVPGDEVYAGQLIGWSDGSGVKADGTPNDPHTHISYYPPGTPVDPDTKKPLQGPAPHSPTTKARTQSDPFDGLGYSRNPRLLNREGYTGKQPMRVDRSP